LNARRTLNRTAWTPCGKGPLSVCSAYVVCSRTSPKNTKSARAAASHNGGGGSHIAERWTASPLRTRHAATTRCIILMAEMTPTSLRAKCATDSLSDRRCTLLAGHDSNSVRSSKFQSREFHDASTGYPRLPRTRQSFTRAELRTCELETLVQNTQLRPAAEGHDNPSGAVRRHLGRFPFPSCEHFQSFRDRLFRQRWFNVDRQRIDGHVQAGPQECHELAYQLRAVRIAESPGFGLTATTEWPVARQGDEP
jgi:hypothetical protein